MNCVAVASAYGSYQLVKVMSVTLTSQRSEVPKYRLCQGFYVRNRTQRFFSGQYIIIPKQKLDHAKKGTTLEPLGNYGIA